MAINRFLIQGNICGKRLLQARTERNMTQEDLARELNLVGMDITPLMISRIEQGIRHVVDGELMVLAKYLQVSMEWLCGEER